MYKGVCRDGYACFIVCLCGYVYLMCILVYRYLCVGICVRMHDYEWVCMYIICICISVCIYINMCWHLFKYACMLVYVYICIHMYMGVCMCIGYMCECVRCVY